MVMETADVLMVRSQDMIGDPIAEEMEHLEGHEGFLRLEIFSEGSHLLPEIIVLRFVFDSLFVVEQHEVFLLRHKVFISVLLQSRQDRIELTIPPRFAHSGIECIEHVDEMLVLRINFCNTDAEILVPSDEGH